MQIKTTRTAFTLLFVFLVSIQGYAASKKEFITSCTYGVLAGTLVGAASLAFTDQPGENLQRVARGASLGLYAGIALGFYVISLTPGDLEDIELPPTQQAPADDPYQYEEGASLKPKIVVPLLSQQGSIDGAYAIWKLHSF